MATVTTKPAASQIARLASTTTLPAMTDKSTLPDAVSASTTISAPENSSGGVSTTVSRSAGLVYQAARPQPSTKKTPASTVTPSHEATSRPTVNTTARPSTAPRPVSLAGRAVDCSAGPLLGGAIDTCHDQLGG
jgi:hypothetical protein